MGIDFYVYFVDPEKADYLDFSKINLIDILPLMRNNEMMHKYFDDDEIGYKKLMSEDIKNILLEITNSMENHNEYESGEVIMVCGYFLKEFDEDDYPIYVNYST